MRTLSGGAMDVNGNWSTYRTIDFSELSIDDLSKEDIAIIRKLSHQEHQRSEAKREIKYGSQELLKYLDITSLDMGDEDVAKLRELLSRFA
jgi:hypothetical protein